MKTPVFVYGSLKKGFGNHPLLCSESTDYVGKGTTPGFSMYSLGGFPGIIPAPLESRIVGELYLVDERTMASLDRLEGHPTFYCREEVTIRLDTGATMEAWVYVYNGDVSERDYIPDGDWQHPQRGR